MVMARMRPYKLRLWVASEEHLTRDLIIFVANAPKDSPLRLLGVYPEHCSMFPRHRVRLHPGRPPLWTLEFVVVEPDNGVTMHDKLTPIFEKNGWSVVASDLIEKRPDGTNGIGMQTPEIVRDLLRIRTSKGTA